ncbi:MAG: hypothetical protein GF334_00895 [Candidatus Altiarchaeales archaeon]|nr:hypothetical protein [Candidatus Altiarchaeales archaeon]
MNVHEAYDNIEKIICYGFLTVGVTIDGVEIILKNMTDREYERLQFYVLDKDNTASQFLLQVAMATFMINGINVLEDRPCKVEELVSFYSKLPNQFVLRIVEIIRELQERYIETIRYLEGYCYTDGSRQLWKSIGVDGSFRVCTGVPGIDSVGINQVQQSWMLINRQLDDEVKYGQDFGLSIMISSSFNAKGARSVQRSYEVRREELDQLRKDIAKYGFDKKRISEEKKSNQWTAPIKSREDLVRELYRQIRGKKDKHDLFVEQWIERQKKAAEEAKRRAEERQITFRKELESIDLAQVEPSRPVTIEEIQKVKDKPKETTSDYISSYKNLDTRDRYIQKISARVIRSTDDKKR